MIFAINSKDGARASYYIHNLRFDHMGGSRLFRFPVKVLDAFKYFSIYKFALRLRTDLILTAMAFHRCCEVSWEMTAVHDGLGSYDFLTGEVYRLKDESIPTVKWVSIDDGAPVSVVLPAVLFFQTGYRGDFAGGHYAWLGQVWGTE